MARIASTTLREDELAVLISAGLFDQPEVAVEIEGEAIALLDDLCVAESEPRYADPIAELYALAEEFDECVCHTETADLW